MRRILHSVPVYVGIAGLVVGAALFLLFRGGDGREELTLDVYLDRLEAGDVLTAVFHDRDHEVVGELVDGTRYETNFPEDYGDELADVVREASPPVEMDADRQVEPFWMSLLWSLLPVLIIVGVFLWVITQVQGGGGRVMQFGKSRARQIKGDQPKVTFADVAGSDEAVEELGEIRDFLAHPERFASMGARIPKGVLLYGPPGTGKTLLARAVAGEAHVPFFTISGSDFVEMFVGVGASRVRDLFEQAKSAAPAIIFIDEIDAVGRHRGAGMGGGHDEREQTLNQLLVEMDGFDVTSGVIMIAATNRPDILDPALLRPGRFDRQIVVDQPDLMGRRSILEVHARGKPLADEVDLDVVARRTPGFTGADLANLINEAALLAARRGVERIRTTEVEAALDRVIGGPERRTRVMSDKEKWTIAYHEGGHALLGHLLPNTDPIHRVSIVARGRALGWTLALPTEDRYLRSRTELRDQMAMLLGGRVAEEIIFGDPTTGASDDIERVTAVARSMVCEYGMSETIGPQRLLPTGPEPYGQNSGGVAEHSDQMAAAIDGEVRRLVEAARSEARELLTLHRTTLDRLASALVAEETLDEPQLLQIFAEGERVVGNGHRPTDPVA
ncbi:MAG: ATP-dependent zinc metalloprotease FtsH [Actinomycetota bacterium]|nr:ATP-dependent zinc metalloprotease FtsH [Actinomycetota bacterium]